MVRSVRHGPCVRVRELESSCKTDSGSKADGAGETVLVKGSR